MFSKNHYYTHYTVNFCLKHKKQFNINLEILDIDKEFNCLVYNDKELIKTSELFNNWFSKLFEIKKELPKNKLIKHLLSSIWGVISQFKRTIIKTDEEYYNLDVSFLNDTKETKYKLLDTYPYSDENFNIQYHYEVVEAEQPYKYNFRLKPFLTSYSRKMLGEFILQENCINNVMRIHTDGIVFNKNFDFSHLPYYPIDDKEQINLRKIYINPFELRIKDYFEQCIKNKNNSNVSPDFKISNPFFKIDMVPIKTYLSLGEIKPDRKVVPQNLRNLKFDIFQSLYLFKNPDNQKEIEEFVTNLRLKLIFLLYYLYKIKKNIYEKFMIELGEKFINNINLQKTGFGKNLKNEKNNLKVLKNLNVNNLNNNFNFNLNFKDYKNRNKKKLDYYIKKL
jgi:hypothetical protein